MDVFWDAFFAINTSNSEVITRSELERYRAKYSLDRTFVEKWLSVFDEKKRGEITLEHFCEVLGLKPVDARLHFSAIIQQDTKNVEVIMGDVSNEMRMLMLRILCSTFRTYQHDRKEFIQQLKARLDHRFGPIWQCLLSYGAFIACAVHVSGTYLCVKMNGVIFLMYKSSDTELCDQST
ncbi:hypothetical protein AAHC03_0522 [Spirometra sp. Aus1]